MMDNCTECGRQLEKVKLICSKCREPLCHNCHSNNGGICLECYKRYHSNDED